MAVVLITEIQGDHKHRLREEGHIKVEAEIGSQERSGAPRIRKKKGRVLS